MDQSLRDKAANIVDKYMGAADYPEGTTWRGICLMVSSDILSLVAEEVEKFDIISYNGFGGDMKYIRRSDILALLKGATP